MQVVPVCQINYKITSADTVLLEDQFVLQWPVAEEGEHHPVLFWGVSAAVPCSLESNADALE